MTRLCARSYALIKGFPSNMVTTEAFTFLDLLVYLSIFHPNVSGRGYDDTSDEEQNDGRFHLARIALRLNVFTAERQGTLPVCFSSGKRSAEGVSRPF